MIIIAGLGNPTKEYEGTRHNVGFQVIDKIAEKYNIAVDAKKGRAYVGKGIIEGQKVLLVKPQTAPVLPPLSLCHTHTVPASQTIHPDSESRRSIS